MPVRLFFIVVAICFSSVAAAQVYKWTDENGVVHYDEDKPDARHQQFRFQGYNEIESSGNARVRSSMETMERERAQAARQAEQETHEGGRQRSSAKREARELAERCDRYVERIDHIDSRLRAGGYSSSTGNRLRAERRELFGQRARECLRN
ncbi:DUF4124 domain-containing protein [Marinobacter zhanjiangensis]|uniref:DUF4124 domain-containing protein n=1 Tax=Marinobacter zhanjiangensis TaxID=578215 RepID=A0ABQ3B5V2_9GAMM|nr:DUF4124 domain-containing protein [Marinobacter zhanjiangensis]GGY80607.1 hypothetical protein GCM10007071_29960 [Marinobacter zhanjiangensis]